MQQLQDIKDHELRHEQQAANWNAQSVDVGNGQQLTRKDVSETDSMGVQSTISFNSNEYKGIYRHVTGLGISMGEVRKAADSGDLAGLGKQVRERRGIQDITPATVA